MPAGYTAILHHLRAYSGLGPVTGNILTLQDGGTLATMVRFDPSNIQSSGAWEWTGKIVMGTGSVINLVSLQNPKDIVLSGWLLPGVAPVQIVGSPVP